MVDVVPEVSNNGVRIAYEVTGRGRPLVLLHGWCCDRTWWTEPGYVADLERDHRVLSADMRGHGASDKPHDPAAYRIGLLIGDVLALADAEGFDQFAIWGQSYGGWVAWMTASAVPERVPALVASGAWDPGPDSDEDLEWFEAGWGTALRTGGTRALVDLFEQEWGEAFDREFPEWARAVTLSADPEAVLASQSRELRDEGLTDIHAFPVPVLLIAGELEDEDDDAARFAGLVPRGQSLRLPNLGHGGACAASALTVPTARAFLQHWFPFAGTT